MSPANRFLLAIFIVSITCILVYVGIATAGEDISIDKDNSGHRIEQVDRHYGIGSIGMGRFNGENSVSVGAGLGMKLAEQDRVKIFGEGQFFHYGTYHTGHQHCVPVLASAGEYKKPKERPKEQPTLRPEQCANIDDAQDYVGAILEIKANLDIDRGWEPFMTLGAAVGDLDGAVWGAGLQWKKLRLQYRDGGDKGLFTVSYEFW